MKLSKLSVGLRFAAAALWDLALWIASLCLIQILSKNAINRLFYAGLAAMVLLAATIIANFIAAALYKKKKQSASVAEVQVQLLQRKNKAQSSLSTVVRRIHRLRHFRLFYLVWLFFLMTVSMGGIVVKMAGSYSTTIVVLLAVWPFYSVFRQLPPRMVRPDFSEYSDPEEYPLLHQMAYEAAQTLGISGKEIRIFITGDCNAGIAKIGESYSLQLGAILLNLLSEEELKQVLIHEFAHMTPDCVPSEKEKRLADFIGQDSSQWRIFYSFVNLLYLFEFFLYQVTASREIERLADTAILRHGKPAVAASALMKIDFYERFFSYETDDFLFYETEEVREDLLSLFCKQFQSKLAEKEAVWRHLAAVEIEPRSASHPILRARMEALGISDPVLIDRDSTSSDAYREETASILKAADEKIVSLNRDDYTESRKTNYLEPLEKIKKWEESGEEASYEEYRPLLDAMMVTAQQKRAEDFCKTIINKCDNRYATAHAHYILGKILVGRYDPAGIEHLYRAIEINYNYLDECLELIGRVCCTLGLAEELEKYRAFALSKAQEQKDKYDPCSELKASDHLVSETMPQEMKNELLERILAIGEGCIDKIFLVRKIICDDFFSSVFVISFGADTEAEKIGEIMDGIFEYLDTHPIDWHFSLFRYDRETADAVKKVKDALVFDDYVSK